MLSIIIPTLNEELYIERTVKSIKAALTPPFEIIVSDGQSRDHTVEVAKACADKVVEYTGVTRQTIAAGRNAGAKAATGEFLVFMDADCSIPGPDFFFGKILKHFARDPKLVAVNVAIRVLPGSETFADWAIYNLFNDYLWFVNNVLHIGIAAGEFQMVRRDVFDRIGGYNEALPAAEDVELFNRLSKVGRVRYEKGLKIYHTGRRVHKVGWPKLLWQWNMNTIFMALTGHAYSKSWGGDMTGKPTPPVEKAK
ncbi:MAG: aglE 2 [Candidatus Parcubacteria bacterium]|nr:aglE 2 [Candidatus Parcubacteria bacterium]